MLRNVNAVSMCVLVAITLVTGCVRRTVSITSEPTGALVFLNDQEVGRTTMSTDFLWYGDYDVVLRKKGYKTLKTHWLVKSPWYQKIPFDFVAEVLWPGKLHDQHAQHYTLEPSVDAESGEVVQRALELQEQAHRAQAGLGDRAASK